MVTDKFPLEQLNDYYVGREFVRISPITKHHAKGIVKEVVMRRNSIEKDEVHYSRPQLGIISTQNVDYDFNEVYFNFKSDISERERIFIQIKNQKEEEKLEKIVE
jgi:hypothetical protein